MKRTDKQGDSFSISRFLLNNRWGGQCLISLYISLLSGIVLALQYDANTPYYSSITIELIVPYGAFWRSLHYYSSQAFFLLLLAHLVVVLVKGEAVTDRSGWIRLSSSIPAAVLLLFTGYVLRGDATGEAAGIIAENICLSIPLMGEWINDLLFDITDSGLRKVYMHHLIGLVALGGFTLWPHLKRYPAFWRNHPLLIAGTLLISILLTAPVEPERMGLLHIAGPWFFLGLQELLRYLPIFIAGVLTPLVPLALLFLLPKDTAGRSPFYWGLGIWVAGYAVLTVLGYLRI